MCVCVVTSKSRTVLNPHLNHTVWALSKGSTGKPVCGSLYKGRTAIAGCVVGYLIIREVNHCDRVVIK